MELLNINQAAELAGKSIQTIRRMIKQKKVRIKKQTTPQGFNYLIIKDSLSEYIEKMAEATALTQETNQQAPTTPATDREHRPLVAMDTDLFKGELERFGATIQSLIEQNKQDKENFFGLIKTFQDRIFHLENQIKLLEAPKKRWWQMRIF